DAVAAAAAVPPAASRERSGLDVDRDGGYGPDPRWHRLDLYRPVHRPGPWPVVFYAHGGAVHLLSKDTHLLMGLVFARFGYLVVNISYRPPPPHPPPAPPAGTRAPDTPAPPPAPPALGQL